MRMDLLQVVSTILHKHSLLDDFEAPLSYTRLQHQVDPSRLRPMKRADDSGAQSQSWGITYCQPICQSQHNFGCAASISISVDITTIAQISSIPSEPTASVFDAKSAWRSETMSHIPASLHRCDTRGVENLAGRYKRCKYIP